MSKRLVKQVVTAALLTTTALSFSPVALGASNTVDQSISNVKVELNKATTHYVYPALEGKLAPSSGLYSPLNKVKKNYQLTRSAIGVSKLSTAQKQSKINEIDSIYNEKVSGGLVPYIDAYNYATKYLVPIMNEIEVAKERNDFAEVEKAYHKLSYQLKGRTAILYRFSGKAARDLLLEQYKKPADAKRDELMVPVTIYMKTVEINDLITNGKMAEAKVEYAEIDALLYRLPSAASNKFVAALMEEVMKVKAAVGELTPVTPPVTTPVDPAPTEPTLPSQQDVLTSKVSNLVTTLNTAQGEKVTVSTSGLNALLVNIKEDESIVDYLGKGFYSTFITQLGVTKVNGFNPQSVEAITYVNSLLPSTADTLVDLRGTTITLPITVNNGSALDVKYTITFQ